MDVDHIRTLVVDDVDEVREGLARLLRHVPGIDVVGTAVDGEDALRQVEVVSPNVVLMDMRMPKLDGLGATRAIASRHPDISVIVLSAYGDESLVVEALLSGACGYLLKGTEISELAEAVHAAGNGESRLSGSVTKPLLERLVEALGVERKLRESAEAAKRDLARSEAEARSLAARLASLIDAAPVAVIETDLCGQIQRWNPAAEHIYGWTQDDLLGRRDPNESPEESLPTREHIETRHVRRDRTPVDVELVVANVPGHGEAPGSRLKIVSDVTERRRLEQELQHQAFHDALTGLANRALFVDRLSQALARVRRASSGVGLLLLDLDGFKTVNDSFGHGVGDEVLVSAANVLRSSLRAEDTIARLGGDEFAVLVETTDDQRDAAILAERMLAALREPLTLNGRVLSVDASIGVAEAHGPDGTDAETLLRNADIAMYAAKSMGKGRYVRFEPDMLDALLERVRVEGDLRTALEANQFELHYQPIVALPSGELQSLEALLRWSHPSRGDIPPLAFIGIAEEMGLMPDLGAWVLRTACTQLAAWHREFPDYQDVGVSVNVSPMQLAGPTFPEQVAEVLSECGLAPRLLTLEITEGVLVSSPDSLDALRKVKALGVRIAIDDFGTGYSSLGYLRSLDVDVLKIDKSFIDHIASEQDAAALTDTIVSMAASLRLHTVAEGIADHAQLERLVRARCPSGQGFLFAKPQTAEAIADVLRALPRNGPLASYVLGAGH
jgi:diguanylate cyclase (GGDEF)-like protein/PAS domain S-box-containing protein